MRLLVGVVLGVPAMSVVAQSRVHVQGTVGVSGNALVEGAGQSRNAQGGQYGELAVEYRLPSGLRLQGGGFMARDLKLGFNSCPNAGGCRAHWVYLNGVFAAVSEHFPRSRTGLAIGAVAGGGLFDFRRATPTVITDAMGPGLFYGIEVVSPALWRMSLIAQLRDYVGWADDGWRFRVRPMTFGIRTR